MTDLHPREVGELDDPVQLLDVREPAEWAAGHIEGALHVPMQALAGRLDALAQDRRIVCVCRSGHRSAAVAEALRRAGYDAVNLLGGMHAWAADGLPMASDGPHEPYVA